jgi:urocanate hydratase
MGGFGGDPNDIAVTDEVVRNLFPDNKSLIRWLDLAKEKVFRDCQRESAGWDKVNEKKRGSHSMNSCERGRLKHQL